MNIIETIQNLLLEFPKIGAVCNQIHVDFTDPEPTNYGLSSTGDQLIGEDVIGNQLRQHNFALYAVFQSQSDYDRLANSGAILELHYWLERRAYDQTVTVEAGDQSFEGILKKVSCANGMLISVPNGNFNDGILYQLQISAQYKIESEEL